jgi:nicotinate-nucleotide adenylyltransferase
MASTRVGLLGGTFDPPHLGHLVAAESARIALALDEVQFVVAGSPWMKEDYSDPEHRVRMTERAIDGDPHFTVNRTEVDRPGVTYTVDTLQALRAQDPGVTLFFLLGADAAARLPEWREVDKALELATFVVLTRPGYDTDPDDLAAEGLERVEMPAIGISSTDLRRRFAAGEAVRHLVPLSVEAYVREHRLYEAAPNRVPERTVEAR